MSAWKLHYRRWLALEQTLIFRTDDSPLNQNSSNRLNSTAQIKLSRSSLSPSPGSATLCCFLSNRVNAHGGLHSSRLTWALFQVQRGEKPSSSCFMESPSISSAWIILGHVPTTNQTLQPRGRDGLHGHAWVISRGASPRKNMCVLLPKGKRISSIRPKQQILKLPVPLYTEILFVIGPVWFEEAYRIS